MNYYTALCEQSGTSLVLYCTELVWQGFGSTGVQGWLP